MRLQVKKGQTGAFDPGLSWSETMSEETNIEETVPDHLDIPLDPDPSEEQESNETTVTEEVKKEIEDKVPYQRFKKVNTEKNQFKTENQQLKETIQRLTGVEKQPETVQDVGPKRAQYQSDEAFIDARYQWNESVKSTRTRQQQEDQRKAEASNKYASELEKAEKKYNNFRPALESVQDIPLSETLRMAIMTDENAGDLTHALATNRAELERISRLTDYEAVREIGRLSARIPGSKGQPNKMSGMPSPINPVGSGSPNTKRSFDEKMDQSTFNANFPYEELDSF